MIKRLQKAKLSIAFASIISLPMASFAEAKPVIATDLLQHPGKNVLYATPMAMFQQATSSGTDAGVISKITLAYFTSSDCTGTSTGSGFYTTPDGSSFAINVGTPFWLVAASAWSVGSTKLSITDMTTIQSIAVTFRSTNQNTPQANFSGVSFACIPVTCTAGPNGQCTSASGTQSFMLKTTAAIGDPANGGVIACLDGGLNNLVAATFDNVQPYAPGIFWGYFNVDVGAGAQSDTDGAANTAAIVTRLGAATDYAAGLCQAYTSGGYNTWFLPANNQLACLNTNQVAIGNFDMSNPLYWSSTESSTNSEEAWYQYLGSTQQPVLKTDVLGARCVQALP